MATTTTNFGWTVPQSTDLVKDGATAISTLGSGVDTSFVGLKGGTTGQILSKTSGTDLAYTWVTAQVGDITGVTAGTGISGGGTSGDVTVTNSMATAITTNGDLIRGTGSGTFSRLGIGSTGQVLTVAAGIPSWATASSKFVQIVSTQTGAVATGTTQIPLDDSIPQNTEGDQYMSLAITPTSATNRLLIQVVTNTAADSIKTNTAALFVDSTASALAAVSNVTRAAGDLLIVSFAHNMVAGSTSAMTFKVRIGPDGGATLTFNGSAGVRRYGGVIASSITITEYTP